MEFLMVLMFLIAGIFLFFKPYKKSLVIGFGTAGIVILILSMAYINKFTVLPMGNF